jgi:guanylate kinase
MKKGIPFIISGFSGAGKGTVLKEVFLRLPELRFSVSATSRQKRAGEIDGEHYHFMSEAGFEKLIAEGAFLEHTKTFGYYYGTLKSEMEKPISQGYDVVFDINVVGAKKIKEQYPEAVSVFITPPTLADLKTRLLCRNSENEETLNRRIREAESEILEMENYDYILVNDDVKACADALTAIIKSARHQTKRNTEIIKLLSEECRKCQ